MSQEARIADNLEAGLIDSGYNSIPSEREEIVTRCAPCGCKKIICFMCIVSVLAIGAFAFGLLSKSLLGEWFNSFMACAVAGIVFVIVWAMFYTIRKLCFKLSNAVRRSSRSTESLVSLEEGRRQSEQQQGDAENRQTYAEYERVEAHVDGFPGVAEDDRIVPSTSSETRRIAEPSVSSDVYNAAGVSQLATSLASIISEALAENELLCSKYSKKTEEQSTEVSGAEKKSASESELRQRKILNLESCSLTSSSEEELKQ